MRILIACESSGVVRDAFRALGHEAWSCDLLASESPGPHLRGDVLNHLRDGHQHYPPCPLCHSWDLMIAHPPCTYLSSSGMHWTTRGLRPKSKTDDAIRFAEALWAAPIPKIAIENPVGCLSTSSALGKPSQIIQPYEFGDDASKQTCLWLKNLPLLQPTKYIPPRITHEGKERWSNQTDSGQNKLPPSETRWKDRSRTYSGIAQAMATQWGALIFETAYQPSLI